MKPRGPAVQGGSKLSGNKLVYNRMVPLRYNAAHSSSDLAWGKKSMLLHFQCAPNRVKNNPSNAKRLSSVFQKL
jgi:hypothetical protein